MLLLSLILSTNMHSPRESHLEVAYRILKYLKGTPEKGIYFGNSDDKRIKAYTDAYTDVN